MNNYKSCKSYEIIFGDGLFFEFKALKLTNNNVLAKAKVHHSMAFSLPPLRPWVAFNPAGGVITAHCDCIAGLGECCSHVGAIIFGALVVNAQKTTLTVTDQPMKWLRKSVKPGMVDTISELKNTQKKAKKKKKVSHSDLTVEEFTKMMDEFMDNGIPAGILTVLPQYSMNFIPLELRVTLPEPMSSLFSLELKGKPMNVLLLESERYFHKYSVSEEQVSSIEQLTRKQSKSENWNKYRRGRVTASMVKSVVSTKIDNPAKTTVMKSCYPMINTFTTEATKWGVQNEKKALKSWKKLMEQRSWHTGFTISDAGLTISTDFPFLAASPDAHFNCPCHGKAVVEVKCPFKHANSVIRDAALQDLEFCLSLNQNGQLYMKRNHAYYHQVQFQMLVCRVNICFFIVYTKVDLVALRIRYDEKFCDSILPKC
ncbi:hypothetical protein OUZ56_027255 [Daphnia magna]|uniref:YqaJ viral recombinase domain-containing protein n=1 Tax=Daphnia magna TaxID=35525 RepID=A0ABQ9ZP98_9CRUS|nr:hypothetical protein OUZ56_027255 [Daphnia magna]